MRPSPLPVPVWSPPKTICSPSSSRVAPSISGHRTRTTRIRPLPILPKPSPRPTHPPGNSTPVGKISHGDAEAPIPGQRRLISLPGPKLDHPALPHTMGCSSLCCPTKLSFSFFFFFFVFSLPKKKSSNLPSSAPTRLVYFEPGLQNWVGEAGGK